MTSWGRSLGGFPTRWQDQFNWLGTKDPAPFLAAPAAIEFLERIGLDVFRQYTHQLAQSARMKLEEFFQRSCWVPDSPEWYGSMVSVPFPADNYKKPKPNAMHPLQKELRERFRIEVPFTECRGQRLLRVSCHLYNTMDDIDYLIDSLKTAESRD
jgi:isopenicillin-N epimerase